MPIILNNSNIEIQYNTGSSYVIETVKSDLYVRGTTSGNLSSEPTTTPTLTANIGVFTHSGGTENQTPHTIFFPENTVCDILIVGGGGGGSPGHGGGGGAGQLVLISNATLSGIYDIKVGKGGIGGRSSELANSFPATKGSNSSFGTVIAEGGGANTNIASDKNGGSGAGGDGYNNDGGTSGFGNKNTTIDTFPGATLYSRGNNGGSNTGAIGGGGGGAGTAAPAGSSTTPFSIGGDGLSGISDINYDFKTNFGNYGKLESDGNCWFAGGGGGGASSVSAFGGKGGGGNGSYNPATVGNATNNTGSGGGGGAGGSGSGGNGGSGIVIIKVISPTTNKYLFFNYLPAQPTLNYTLNFPTRTMVNFFNSGDEVMNGQYTVSVRTTQSTITPTQGQNLQDRLYFTSNLAIRYHTLNPVKTTEGAQWTYTSNNPNVYHMGNVGIGTTNPEYNLDVRGSIYSSIGGYTGSTLTTWSITSDRRIKENIVKASYEKCLENVNKIELYNFNFKDNCVNTNDKHQLGFIAQEVREVYPKAVEVNKMILNTNETIDDILTLNTTQIDYTLYGAVKNLIEKIDNIDIELENLGSNITYNKDLIRNTSNIFSIITSNISITTSNIFTGTSNISITTSNISIITSNIFISTSNIPTETSNIPTETSNIPITTSYIPFDTSNISIN